MAALLLSISAAGPALLAGCGLSVDLDGDGWNGEVDCADCVGSVVRDGRSARCNDIHPDAPELCDAFDNDCDGLVDEDAVDGNRYDYADRDGDGVPGTDVVPVCVSSEVPRARRGGCGCSVDLGGGWQGGILRSCAASGMGRFDCDDNDPSRSQDAEEVCDGVDNDCDGRIDEAFDILGSTASVCDDDDDDNADDDDAEPTPYPPCDAPGLVVVEVEPNDRRFFSEVQSIEGAVGDVRVQGTASACGNDGVDPSRDVDWFGVDFACGDTGRVRLTWDGAVGDDPPTDFDLLVVRGSDGGELGRGEARQAPGGPPPVEVVGPFESVGPLFVRVACWDGPPAPYTLDIEWGLTGSGSDDDSASGDDDTTSDDDSAAPDDDTTSDDDSATPDDDTTSDDDSADR